MNPSLGKEGWCQRWNRFRGTKWTIFNWSLDETDNDSEFSASFHTTWSPVSEIALEVIFTKFLMQVSLFLIQNQRVTSQV